MMKPDTVVAEIARMASLMMFTLMSIVIDHGDVEFGLLQ